MAPLTENLPELEAILWDYVSITSLCFSGHSLVVPGRAWSCLVEQISSASILALVQIVRSIIRQRDQRCNRCMSLDCWFQQQVKMIRMSGYCSPESQ
jgi:hypothetical protein